ncbi:hypothetical protein NITHO_3850004 [Nitrolancea hollandica Lb]|uniref:Uncharacterized protein n=1 Tax=Nitrolancea hollandica Lb TaxID=1129897 RepID=I4EJ67_9BACT|nr:hypothetical protein NITHO_3850004 [Nitrolancea hollandica Lb]
MSLPVAQLFSDARKHPGTSPIQAHALPDPDEITLLKRIAFS